MNTKLAQCSLAIVFFVILLSNHLICSAEASTLLDFYSPENEVIAQALLKAASREHEWGDSVIETHNVATSTSTSVDLDLDLRQITDNMILVNNAFQSINRSARLYLHNLLVECYGSVEGYIVGQPAKASFISVGTVPLLREVLAQIHKADDAKQAIERFIPVANFYHDYIENNNGNLKSPGRETLLISSFLTATKIPSLSNLILCRPFEFSHLYPSSEHPASVVEIIEHISKVQFVRSFTASNLVTIYQRMFFVTNTIQNAPDHREERLKIFINCYCKMFNYHNGVLDFIFGFPTGERARQINTLAERTQSFLEMSLSIIMRNDFDVVMSFECSRTSTVRK